MRFVPEGVHWTIVHECVHILGQRELNLELAHFKICELSFELVHVEYEYEPDHSF